MRHSWPCCKSGWEAQTTKTRQFRITGILAQKEQSYEAEIYFFLVPDSAGALSLADVSSDPVRLVAGAIGSKGVRIGARSILGPPAGTRGVGATTTLSGVGL
jgi:hypothetical protein